MFLSFKKYKTWQNLAILYCALSRDRFYVCESHKVYNLVVFSRLQVKHNITDLVRVVYVDIKCGERQVTAVAQLHECVAQHLTRLGYHDSGRAIWEHDSTELERVTLPSLHGQRLKTEHGKFC